MNLPVQKWRSAFTALSSKRILMRIFSRNVMGWQNLEKNNPKSKYKVSKISQPNFGQALE